MARRRSAEFVEVCPKPADVRGDPADAQRVAVLFAQPRHPYTQHLIRSLPKIDDRSEKLSIPGRPPALDRPPGGCRFHPRCPYAMEICSTEVPALEQVGPNHRVACWLVSSHSATAETRHAEAKASMVPPASHQAPAAVPTPPHGA